MTLNKIVEWIRLSISKELTINLIAEHFNISRAYLDSIFKTHLKKSPLKYLIDLKISVAKVLLVQTDLPVKIIFELSYFHSEKHFLRTFRIKTGFTPTEYRNHFDHSFQNSPLIDPKIPIPREVQVKYNIQYYSR